MESNQISNSIYISMASLEVLIICVTGMETYYYGILWLFPLMLFLIPAYRIVKPELENNKRDR
ncbi:hypothetical protein QBE53_16315 [Vallitaleaceae bacterium 9-2]